ARIVEQDTPAAEVPPASRNLFAIGDVELYGLNRLAWLDRRGVSRRGIYFRGAGIAQRLDQGPPKTSLSTRHKTRRPADFHDSPGRRRSRLMLSPPRPPRITQK